ncbi:MAG: MATE family efflux transporter [Clostridia bacterium]|nr:MATE family efflux transporter [Clostridia bacterium]MEE1125574.1 MATE family efflux transporter [Acutalibacteraceae bacterium]
MKKLKLFNLAWPIFIETALFMFLGFVDVFVLSDYNDLAASSVNTANQAVSIVTIVFSVISGASAVLISQYLGAENKKGASRIAALSLTFNLIFGCIISVALAVFNRPILSFIGAKGEVLEFASQYLTIVGGFLFLQATLNAMAVIIRNHGMTQISMYVTVGMNIVNTVLDVIFVKGLFGMPQLGVVGVAVATTFSRIVGTIILAVVLFKYVEKPEIFKLLKPFPFKDVKNIIKIGVPSALESFLYNLSQLVVTSIVLNCLTNAELITKTYVQNITMFFYIFAVAIGQASQILTGHLVGGNKLDEAYKQGFRGYRNALIITVIIATTGIIFRAQLMDIFTNDTAVITMGANILIINLILELGRTTNLVVIACLRGAGDVVFPTACAIFSMWVISALGSYILAVVCGMGIYGLWIAFAADECFRGILMIWRWKSGKWKNKMLTAE